MSSPGYEYSVRQESAVYKQLDTARDSPTVESERARNGERGSFWGETKTSGVFRLVRLLSLDRYARL